MIQLYGFSISNYFNKVKMVLLEKGLPFEVVRTGTGSKMDDVLSASPLAKIPFIRTPEGSLCESAVICDWLEAAYPTPPLMPSPPFAAAKVRELNTYIEMHLELVVREIYAEAFFGGQVSDEVKASVRRRLEKNIAAFKRLAKFSPYVAGEQFTLADCAAWVSLPLVSMATTRIYGLDLLEAGGVDWRPYVKMIGERPSAQRVLAERKADQEAAKAAAAAAAPAAGASPAA